MADENKTIGDIGEDSIEQLCQLPIGNGFLFRGPMYMTDKGEVAIDPDTIKNLYAISVVDHPTASLSNGPNGNR